MDRRLQLILLMPEDDFITNRQLSETLGVSNRTVYNDITQLNQMMRDKGAQLISKPRYGVKLVVTDRGKFLTFLRSLETDAVTVGDSAETRLSKAVERMILADAPIRMDDLADELHISRSTLKMDLKKARLFLGRYSLEIDYRSYTGMRILGTEKNLRRCLAKIDQNMIASDGSFLSTDMDAISAILKDIFKRYRYRMAAYSFQNFVTHVYVSICRIRQGKEIAFTWADERSDTDRQLKEVAEAVVMALEKAYKVTFSRAEYQYILLHLECKKIVTGKRDTVVTAEVYEAVTQMLREVQRVFHYDFQHDFELITNLSTHIVPLRLRLQYDMPFENPMLSEIREGELLSYEMANVACGVLAEIYGKKVSPDEVAYIALHFHVAIERYKKRYKKNVLIVCGTGKGSAMLLAYRVKEEYGKYLNVVGTHESIDLSEINFTHVDYLLTTVPIHERVPVPVIEISKPFSRDGHSDLRKYFQNDRRESLMGYFSEDLFLPQMSETSKNDVLRRLCDMASSRREVPGDLYDHVLRREEIGGTDFGNYVAIPHPDQPVGEESFVVTGLLAQPVVWDQEEVRIVFLLSMKDGGDRNLQLFYKTVSRFLSDKVLVQRLIQNQSYEELISILDSLSYDT